jgi:hypothetical protein
MSIGPPTNPSEVLRCFPQSLEGNSGIVYGSRLWLLLVQSFQVHHLLYPQPDDAPCRGDSDTCNTVRVCMKSILLLFFASHTAL